MENAHAEDLLFLSGICDPRTEAVEAVDEVSGGRLTIARQHFDFVVQGTIVHT